MCRGIQIRKCIRFLFITSLLMLAPLSCYALSLEEWNQWCWSKTNGQTTLYSLTVNEETGEKVTTAIGSLPSGTYVRSGDNSDRELHLIEVYYYPGGTSDRGYISSDNITSATKWIYYSDGSCDQLPEALVDNPAALKAYMDKHMPGYNLNGDGSKPVNPYSTLPEEEADSDTSQPDKSSGVEQTKGTKPTEQPLYAELEQEREASEEEKAFIASCPQRLGSTVRGSKTYQDYTSGKSYESIPIGTYCRITDEHDDVVQISYYKASELHSAYIPRSTLMGAYTQYKENPDDDYSTTVYTGDPHYEEIVAGKEITWLAESIQNDLDGQVAAERAIGSSSDSQSGNEGKKVEVKSLGISYTTISYNGKEETVQTDALNFSQNAPEGKELAVIYAPRTGKVSVRKTASTKGKTLKKAKAGTIVLVLDVDGDWTRILYKNQTGFVPSSCLKYYSVNTKAKAVGTICYKGKTIGKATINIRNAADKRSFKVAEWKVGKKVAVLSQDNGWAEIEADGICGFVQEKYITYK